MPCSSGRTQRRGSCSAWPSSWPPRRWAAPGATGGHPAARPCSWPVWTADSGGARRLLVAAPQELTDGTAAPVTPAGLQVRGVADIDGDTVLFSASGADPASVSLWLHGPDGLTPVTPEHGVSTGRRA